MKEISIEGLSPDEILQLTDEEVDQLVLIGRPLVFRVGSSEILGGFKLRDRSLVVELAQIDGGGEGVLPLLGSLSRRYAKKRGLDKVEWVVHALNCAEPNLKLRRVMERRGFKIEDIPGVGPAYSYIDDLTT
jgi:hypothetical protein